MKLCSLRVTRVTRRVCLAMALTVALLAGGVAVRAAAAAPTENPKSNSANDAKEKAKARPAPRKTGLLINDPTACQGYTLLASANSTMTYLIDMQGRIVRTWKSDCNPGLSAVPAGERQLAADGSSPQPSILWRRGRRASPGVHLGWQNRVAIYLLHPHTIAQPQRL